MFLSLQMPLINFDSDHWGISNSNEISYNVSAVAMFFFQYASVFPWYLRKTFSKKI